MNLIINADLSNPPSARASIRELSFFAHEFKNYHIILETNNNKDIYYQYLRGIAMDYIEDITRIGEEQGLRIEMEPSFPPSILVDRISVDTMSYLLRSIGVII
jgi:5'-3' exonuclease